MGHLECSPLRIAVVTGRCAVVTVLACILFGPSCSQAPDTKIADLKSQKAELNRELDRRDSSIKALQTDVERLRATLTDAESEMRRLEQEKTVTVPTLPGSVVLSKAVDAKAIAEVVALATYDLIYVLDRNEIKQGGHQLAELLCRGGRIVLLGREGDDYLGFTTTCAVDPNYGNPTRYDPRSYCLPLLGISTGKDMLWLSEGEPRLPRDPRTGKLQDGIPCALSQFSGGDAARAADAWARLKRDSSFRVRIDREVSGDVALVRIPAASAELRTMGLQNPRSQLRDSLARATEIFGHKFFLQCERCYDVFQRLPDYVSAAYQEGYGEGYRRGFFGFVSLIVGLLGGLLDSDLPGAWQAPIVEATGYLGKELEGVLVGELRVATDRAVSRALDEFLPRSPQAGGLAGILEMMHIERPEQIALAGIDAFELDSLESALRDAEEVVVIPDHREGTRRLHILADGEYVNQGLLARGRAVAGKGRAFVFREEFRTTEQFAKSRRLGRWTNAGLR